MGLLTLLKKPSSNDFKLTSKAYDIQVILLNHESTLIFAVCSPPWDWFFDFRGLNISQLYIRMNPSAFAQVSTGMGRTYLQCFLDKYFCQFSDLRHPEGRVLRAKGEDEA